MKTNQVLGVDRGIGFSKDEYIELEKHGVKGIGFYLGGPYYSMNAWNKTEVHDALNRGFGVIPIYVGQNYVKGGALPTLNASQGAIDGADAIRLMHEYGIPDVTNLPIVLDVEISTWEYNPNLTAEYAYAWMLAVRQHGVKDGIYGSLGIIDKLTTDHEPPRWVWLANWVSKGIDTKLKLDSMPGLPNSMFVDNQRCWQYSGNVGLPGLQHNVDINLFDSDIYIKLSDVNSNTVVPVTTNTNADLTEDTQVKNKIDKAIALLNDAISTLKG